MSFPSDRQVIGVPTDGSNSCTYILTGEQGFRIESIAWDASHEGPSTLQGYVLYNDAAGNRLATMSTLRVPFVPTDAHWNTLFCFAIGGSSLPSIWNRFDTPPLDDSPFDSNVLTGFLPDTVLSPGMSISLELDCRDNFGAALDISIGSPIIYAQLLDGDSDVVPLYTHQTTELQLSEVAVGG